MSDVVFDEARHAYEVDGKELPSVTQLVAVLGDDGDIDEDILERAADRGTTCHAIIAMALQGEDYSGEYPAMYQPWVDSIEAFLHEHNIVPLMIETPLGNTTLGYAGTPDLVCEFDGSTALLDYKCVSQVNKTKVKAQLNAYDQLLAYEGVQIEERYAVQFTKEGYRLYPVAFGMEEFDACQKIYELKQKKHPRGKIA